MERAKSFPPSPPSHADWAVGAERRETNPHGMGVRAVLAHPFWIVRPRPLGGCTGRPFSSIPVSNTSRPTCGVTLATNAIVGGGVARRADTRFGVVAREGETVIGRAPRLYKPKILIVEDSDTMWFLYNDLLAGEYDLQRATDGRQALLELVRMKPDVIILDWTLDDIRPWDEEADTTTAAAMRATTPAPMAPAGQKAVSGMRRRYYRLPGRPDPPLPPVTATARWWRRLYPRCGARR